MVILKEKQNQTRNEKNEKMQNIKVLLSSRSGHVLLTFSQNCNTLIFLNNAIGVVSGISSLLLHTFSVFLVILDKIVSNVN